MALSDLTPMQAPITTTQVGVNWLNWDYLGVLQHPKTQIYSYKNSTKLIESQSWTDGNHFFGLSVPSLEGDYV